MEDIHLLCTQMKDLTKISCCYLQIKSDKRIEHLPTWNETTLIDANLIDDMFNTYDVEQMNKTTSQLEAPNRRDKRFAWHRRVNRRDWNRK